VLQKQPNYGTLTNTHQNTNPFHKLFYLTCNFLHCKVKCSSILETNQKKKIKFLSLNVKTLKGIIKTTVSKTQQTQTKKGVTFKN